MNEHEFLRAIHAQPDDPEVRAVYADWLEERGDRRAEFVRTHLQRRLISRGHRGRRKLQRQLAELERGLDRRWLAAVAPERERDPNLTAVEIAVHGLKNRVEYIPDASTDTITEILSGILFVMAWWSGPSHASFRILRETLREYDPHGLLKLVISDVEQITHGDMPEMFGQKVLHGSGEMIWIEGGEVVASATHGFPARATLLQHTRKLATKRAALSGLLASHDPKTSRLDA